MILDYRIFYRTLARNKSREISVVPETIYYFACLGDVRLDIDLKRKANDQ